VLRINEKKCGVCKYFTGKRTIVFSANKPALINAETTKADCLAYPKKQVTPGGTCLRFQKWEKI